MSQSKCRRPFVLTIVALASTTKLGCGSTSEDGNAVCKVAKAGTACTTEGESCPLDVACASGAVTVSLACTTGYWQPVPAACAHQGDECEMHYRCESGSWQFLGGGGNPPAPCPVTPPVDGTECHPGGGFGADPANCGYPCDDGAGWSLVSCLPPTGTTATWSAGACDPNG